MVCVWCAIVVFQHVLMDMNICRSVEVYLSSCMIVWVFDRRVNKHQ